MACAQEKAHRSTSPLRCCQSSDSLTSESISNDILCETKNSYVISPNNNNNFYLQHQEMKKYHFPKKQAVNVTFEDITYTTWSWSLSNFRREHKEILHKVSGEFKSGELSVIMGPSGAGKTSLLNILAGFTTTGMGGTVKVNDVVRTRNPKFRKLSAYIPQDEEIRLALTAKEAMTFAANLKLGYGVSSEYKNQQVNELLELLGLEECHHTVTAQLSGGQRKRLGIALELLSNPPILFLDEPTTGLDSSSCAQCVSLLKRLAQEGRTVVCTIHQPSALLFEMFDNLYALSQGHCIYDGKTRDLVPHLSTVGLRCPPYHNPADFLMEVAIGEYGTPVHVLEEAARAKKVKDGKILQPKEKESLTTLKKAISVGEIIEEITNKPASVPMQLFLLFKRNLVTTKRCYVHLVNRFLAHILIGLLFGYLYRGVGNGANTVFANYVYLYGSLLLIVYTGKMSVTVSFPLEMKILTREHFNRWYKLSPYILSVVLIEIPFQIICTWSYLTITFYLTEQPVDFRLYLLVLFFTLTTLCAQSWGYFLGATTPIKIAVFLGPILACLFSVFGFCIRYSDTPVIFRWIFHISYFRAAFQSVMYTVYGLDRPNLHCPEEILYCHYIQPKKLLKEMELNQVDLVSNISVIVIIWCIMHAATYLTLWFKLNKR